MISFEDAVSTIVACAKSRPAVLEQVTLRGSPGRVLAEDVYARDCNPRFDNSAMDGFLLRAADTSSASSETQLEFKVGGCLAAGRAPEIVDGAGCLEIMTGARIAEGPWDTVLRKEDVEVRSDGNAAPTAIIVSSAVEPGENIRRAGEDFQSGQKLLLKGQVVEPMHLMALCMAGASELTVRARPRVAVLTTGAELVPPEAQTLSMYQIRNSNSVCLQAVLQEYGAEVIALETVMDDLSSVKESISSMLEKQPDIILTTGGVSAGRYDLVRETFESLGGQTSFHKVAMRPGKPLLFGDFGKSGPLFFGLPGNPIAVAAGCRFYVKACLQCLLGLPFDHPLKVPMAVETKKPEGLTAFLRGKLVDGKALVLKGQASFMTHSLLEAGGWIVGKADVPRICKGEMIDWYSLC